MEPTPVRVEHDGVLLSGAAVGGGALLHREPWVGLSGQRAGLLAVRDRDVGEGDERDSGEHLGIELERLVAVEDEEAVTRCRAVEPEAGFIRQRPGEYAGVMVESSCSLPVHNAGLASLRRRKCLWRRPSLTPDVVGARRVSDEEPPSGAANCQTVRIMRVHLR